MAVEELVGGVSCFRQRRPACFHVADEPCYGLHKLFQLRLKPFCRDYNYPPNLEHHLGHFNLTLWDVLKFNNAIVSAMQ